MAVEIDASAGTCSVVVDERRQVGPIAEARISTDPQARMSVLELPGVRAHVTEDDVQRLLSAGVRDDRSNLIVDS
ncbi:MAG: DUF3203 family protein [Pseudomonas sp.]|uniref:DUF3203 family protein n=1 Tax=Pseudomonas sp. TaxID=306 RepID=UPI00339672C2